MVRMDSLSSLPPHIQPPMAQVPSAMRALTREVPLIFVNSNTLSFLVSSLEIVSLLAKPLRVGVRAIEMVARFVKLKLAGLRGLGGFCEESGNL